ncbi:TRAP transporter small permease [Marinoscillum sp. MHG1-6]|uniref:TRAP transporter small permease n=1 Tax=Marinoscillum sp. MHG1-6 TaxID=2959627 RepID=UPI002158178B|nr:TRAP transporter small permease [Marinoscillum sp. MHG1-6]
MRAIIDNILSKMLVFLMGIMVINVLWQVASRYLVGSPSTFTDELAGFLLIWVGLLGAGYGTGQGLHLAIDILPNAVEGKKKEILDYVINGFVALFALMVMVIGGARLVFLTLDLEQLSSALEIPLGYVYLVVPLSGAVMVYYSIHNIIKGLKDGSN